MKNFKLLTKLFVFTSLLSFMIACTTTETVEVIKEVPVEKIVKEIVEVDKVVYTEVPKEVVRKEVIHVPIYTNDPDLIKFGTTKVKKILDDD